MGEGGGWLRQLSRRARITVQVAVGVVILMTVGTVGFVEYSAQPSFCLNCHIMEPCYQSWQT